MDATFYSGYEYKTDFNIKNTFRSQLNIKNTSLRLLGRQKTIVSHAKLARSREFPGILFGKELIRRRMKKARNKKEDGGEKNGNFNEM
eukprot:snap_masked-scaffold_2-processed-gene-9.29-mRNA-1 protein AED:1.00 eAED:1.00 QI:0/0/0/0/1/1/2/0/87